MKVEHENLLQKFNDLKLKYDLLERKYLSEGIVRKSLEFQVESLMRELKETQVRAKTFEKHNQELTTKFSVQSKGSRFRKRIGQSMDRKYLGFAIALEKELQNGLVIK